MRHTFLLTASLSICLTACMDLAPTSNTIGKKPKPHAELVQGQVYTLRGGLGGIFSTGMNTIQKRLRSEYNVNAESTIWYKEDTLSDYIIKYHKTNELKGPIILIGHSLGANEVIKVARNIGKANIPVELLVTVDAVSPIYVPPNVKRTLNLYKPGYAPMFSGMTLDAVDPTCTKLENINVNDIKNIHVNHFNIEKNKLIQEIILNNVLDTLHVKHPKK